MNTAASADNRLRAYAQFVTAVLWFFVAEIVARRSALGLVSDAWYPLIDQAVLVFLLIAGYGLMGLWFNRQLHPVSEQGLPLRKDFLREVHWVWPLAGARCWSASFPWRWPAALPS